MINNDVLLQKTVEITIAKLSNSSVLTNKEGGAAVADFMQQIYDKLAELSKNDLLFYLGSCCYKLCKSLCFIRYFVFI